MVRADSGAPTHPSVAREGYPRTVKEIACPRCGAARSSAATFCMNCGQDLRPGAPVTPVPPPGAQAGAGSPTRPAQGSPEGPGPRFRVVRRPSRSGRPVPTAPVARPTAPARPAPAPEPKPDPSLSFSERYRGTPYSSPESEALLPSAPRLTPTKRRGRVAIVGIVVVALVLATAAGAYAFLFAPSAGDIPLEGGATATATVTVSPTPRERATPTPIATTHGLVPDEVEIAGCLVAAEVAVERAALDALLADIAADRHAGVSDRARALAAEVATTAGSLRTIEAFEPAQGLAVAYGRLMALESDALGAIADAADDPQRLAAAAHRPAGLEQAMAAVAAAQTDLLARFPEIACGTAP